MSRIEDALNRPAGLMWMVVLFSALGTIAIVETLNHAYDSEWVQAVITGAAFLTLVYLMTRVTFTVERRLTAAQFQVSTDGNYRKKPVVIDAMQFTGENGAEIVAWMGDAVTDTGDNFGTDLYIHTLEGVMHASPGDWIIKGIQGEFYPCKPDIFALTYTGVDDD